MKRREFTILVVQNHHCPIVLEPIECIFGDGHEFKDYDLKWVSFEYLKYKQIDDKTLFNKLTDFAKDIFVKLRLDGYVRFDIRMDNDNNLFLLDVNPYCGIFYPKNLYGSADFILENSRIMNYKQFVEHLFSM